MIRPSELVVIAAISFGGCGSKAKQPVAPVTPVAAEPAPAATAEPVAASPNVNVSDDLAKQCKLKFANVEVAPKFALDDSQLLPEDRNVLEQVAECLVRGPLKGRSVQLVGRADPRGTEEYNLGLGTRRADRVRSYLERLGVPGPRLTPTTRGDLDARGSDESGWREDRRVDLELVN